MNVQRAHNLHRIWLCAHHFGSYFIRVSYIQHTIYSSHVCLNNKNIIHGWISVIIIIILLHLVVSHIPFACMRASSLALFRAASNLGTSRRLLWGTEHKPILSHHFATSSLLAAARGIIYGVLYRGKRDDATRATTTTTTNRNIIMLINNIKRGIYILIQITHWI